MKTLAYVWTVAFVLMVSACAESRRAPHTVAAASPITNAEPSSGRSHSGSVARVEDATGRLGPEERSALIARLERASTEHNFQLGAIIVPSLNGETIERFSERTFKGWALGDRGILIVIAIRERQARIETGREIESLLPNDRAHAVLVKHLNPHLRADDFAGGIDESFGAVLAVLRDQEQPKVVP